MEVVMCFTPQSKRKSLNIFSGIIRDNSTRYPKVHKVPLHQTINDEPSSGLVKEIPFHEFKKSVNDDKKHFVPNHDWSEDQQSP